LPDFLTECALISVAVIAYYKFQTTKPSHQLRAKITTFVRLVAGRLHLARQYAVSEVDHAVELILAGISQLGFCLLLIWIAHLDFTQLGLTRIHVALILYGILLGIGEMALGSFLVYVSMRIAMILVPERVPTELKDWLTIARGGWMSYYLKTVQIMPLPLDRKSVV
jgi:4-amino-4-deoxy-L-arabinose transferase-like glycosyltransferase